MHKLITILSRTNINYMKNMKNMKQMKHMNYSTNNNNNEQEILNKIRTMQKNISIIVLASTINSISIMFIANEISKNK